MYRAGYSWEAANKECFGLGLEGKLGESGPDVEALYSEQALYPDLYPYNAPTDTQRTFATNVAIIMGVTSFVGGLLGWLLVMKKRILQCTFCGAVVNAS